MLTTQTRVRMQRQRATKWLQQNLQHYEVIMYIELFAWKNFEIAPEIDLITRVFLEKPIEVSLTTISRRRI